jgi:hypothetical protein
MFLGVCCPGRRRPADVVLAAACGVMGMKRKEPLGKAKKEPQRLTSYELELPMKGAEPKPLVHSHRGYGGTYVDRESRQCSTGLSGGTDTRFYWRGDGMPLPDTPL